MERLKRDRARWHIAARLSMLSAILSVFLVIGSIFLLWYIPMGIFIAVAIHGFYFTPFYFRKYDDLTRTEMLLSAVAEGIKDKALLAERASVSETYAERLLKKASDMGYGSYPDIEN